MVYTNNIGDDNFKSKTKYPIIRENSLSDAPVTYLDKIKLGTLKDFGYLYTSNPNNDSLRNCYTFIEFINLLQRHFQNINDRINSLSNKDATIKIYVDNARVLDDDDIYNPLVITKYTHKYAYSGETIKIGQTTYYLWNADTCSDYEMYNYKPYLLTNTVDIRELESQIITPTNHQMFTSFVDYLDSDKTYYGFNNYDQILLKIEY